jgi:hypothetical protein
VRWAFWRERATTPPDQHRPLPDDVGLPTSSRPPAAPQDRDPDDGHPTSAPWTPGARPAASPTAAPTPEYRPPPTAPADVDRTALADAGPQLARVVSALLAGTPVEPSLGDPRTLAVAATGALAARLPALSGVDGAEVFDEPEDELLHAYADVLVGRTVDRRTPNRVDRDDLLAVAHLAAAAAAVGAAGEPALLLLAGAPADEQLRAAALLLAQTADDGGGAPDRLAGEVGGLFGASG